LLAGFAGLVVGFVLEGGEVGSLMQHTAAIIVFGGLIGAVATSFPAATLAKFPKILGVVFRNKKEDREKIMEGFLSMAVIARKEGLLALEKTIAGDEYDEFIVSGIQLVIDGTDPESIKHNLETKISNMEERHEKGTAIFESAGGYAPTMGVIGTVMGLVHVLGNLDDASSLGGKIAVAFIATLYGVGSANLIFLPLASKLKQLNTEEVITKYMMLDGIMMLQNGSNPAFMKEQLKGYLEHAPKKAEQGE
jgi:Flagellar motor component